MIIDREDERDNNSTEVVVILEKIFKSFLDKSSRQNSRPSKPNDWMFHIKEALLRNFNINNLH